MGQVSSNSLITAAKQNLVDEVRALLSFGIDVERMNEQRNNALHVACFAGHHLIVQALLQHKANPNLRNGEGDTPLILAVTSGSILCCKLLVAAKASVVMQDADGYTAVHFAAGFGYLNILSHFIENSPSACDMKSKSGVSPALCAILNGHVECLTYLLRRERNIVTSRVGDRNTLLHISAQEGNAGMCQALLSCGAVVSIQNNNGDSPIDVVLTVFKDASLPASKRHGLRECFLLLMKHREMQELEEEKQVSNKSTPSGFLLAACKGNVAELQRYVQEGFEVDFCNTPDHHGFTALHAACLSGQMESAKVLLANGANINKTTSSGDYPFMLAIISGSPSLVSYLLDMGARHDVVDKFGNTPLHLAMADGNRNIVMILIQKKFPVHSQNRQGLSPLLCAVINGHSAVVKLLCNHDISVLGACTLRGEFPLHLAALLPPANRKQMITSLIDCKAVPTLVNSSGLTALEIALGNNSEPEILDALRLAETRDMENVANGVKNKALRKLPPPPAPPPSQSAPSIGSPMMQATLSSPTRKASMDRRPSTFANANVTLRKMSVQGRLTSNFGQSSLSQPFDLGPAATAASSTATASSSLLPTAPPPQVPLSADRSLELQVPSPPSSQVVAAAPQPLQHVSSSSASAVRSFAIQQNPSGVSVSPQVVGDLTASAWPCSSAASAAGIVHPVSVVKEKDVTISHNASSSMQIFVEQPAGQNPGASSAFARRRHRNALHLAVTAGAFADVHHLLASHPEFLGDLDHEGNTPVSLSLQLVNAAIGTMLRTVGLSHHRHIEATHSDSVRRETLQSHLRVCEMICESVRSQKERALRAEYAGKYRRSAAAACLSDISSILSKSMNSFQESQWRMEQRNLAICLASAFKNRCFRRYCSSRACDRHRLRAQTLIACAYRMHHAKITLLSNRSRANSRSAAFIYLHFHRHKTRCFLRHRAASTIQNAWHLRKPYRQVGDLKRVLRQRKAQLFAKQVLTLAFKFFAARLALAKARTQYLYRQKMIAIAEENQRTGSFAIRLQNVLLCSRARKAYSSVVRQHSCIKIQSFYRCHIARCRAASASADESSLMAFKSGYRYSIFGVSGFVPKVRVNLGGLVSRSALKVQRVWRGHSARTVLSRLVLSHAHACARVVQFQYARHYHFDWYINDLDAKFFKRQGRLVVLIQSQFRRFLARRQLKAAWKAYYVKTFYPGAALKIQAFFRRICSRTLIAPAQLRKLRISQSVFALVIQRVVRGHSHRQLIVQFHASALTLQRAFRGHRSRYLSLGKERSQMEAWVNMWMQMVLAGIEGEVASRDVEAQLNHVLVKPEPANYFLGGSDEIIFDDSFSHLYNLVQKQSVRALHLKIVSMADACLAPSSSVAIARVEALASFIIRCAAIISGQHLADSDSASIGVQLMIQVQQLLDGPLMCSSRRTLFKAWTAFTMANCFVLVERFESALSVLLQYSKSTDSNTVHDCCTVSILVFMSFLRNKIGLYRDAIGSAFEAISILRLFPDKSAFNAFYWWGTDRNPHDAIDLKRKLTAHDLAVIAELNLCSGLCMLGRWSHAHASIKRCAWIKRSDGISLQHLKRILSKYILILQRTISILKLSPLDDTSALGISVWPMISGSISPYLMSPNIRSMSFSGGVSPFHMSPYIRPLATASLEEPQSLVGLGGISSDAKSSSISSFASPHLAGKLRPGSAGMLRPVSAIAQTSFATNESHPSTAVARPATAVSSKLHAVRMMSPDAVARLRYIDGESLSPYKISPLDLHAERMFDPIVSRSSAPIVAPGSTVSSFVSAFHEAGGHVILGQSTKWNDSNERQTSDQELMDRKLEKGGSAAVLAPIWIPFFPVSDRQLLVWESPELSALKDLWAGRQQGKFWSTLSKISREIDDVQTTIGKVNDSLNKHFTMRVQSLCSLCLQLAFMNMSSFQYSLSLRLVDTAQRLSVGCPLSSRLFTWMITIKARALSALSRSKDAAAELSALSRHKRLEADPFLRCCVFQLLSAALMCESHFAAAFQAAKEAVQYAGQTTAPTTCVHMYKKLTSSVRPTLHDIDVAAVQAFAAHNAAIAAHLSGNVQAAEQFSRVCVSAGNQSCCVPNQSLGCFKAVFDAFATSNEDD